MMNHSIKTLIVLLGFVSPAMAGSISPSTAQPAPTNDAYIGYQWGLWNNGQKVTNDIDDIHPIEVTGSPSVQIGWKQPQLDQMMKRDVIVAVIDSGLDTEHEDIQGHIALNDVECDSGHIPAGTPEDKDHNGFPGDCMGWNFATRMPQFQRFVDDDIGHGTHISGIIAAVSGNGLGISGVSNRIKILPLKVYSGSDEVGGDGAPTQLASISDRVAAALDYAVLRKADVINLSLGWPLVNNSEKVKTALRNALNHGILIAAGAGNDRHSAQIYPCALEGVVCVGSIDIDGQVSRFSNFGGHVDVLAPGDNILSLWPMNIQGSATTFGPKGYEILSGTSQATPFVTATLAILRGIYPNASAQELRGKLLAAAASSTAKEEFTLRGLINIGKAVNADTNGLVLPSFKELDHVLVNAQTGSFTLPVRLNNYGPSAQTTNFRLVSLNPQVSFVQPTRAASLAGSGSQIVSIQGKVQSLQSSAILRYQVVINNQAYTHQIFLTQDLMQNNRVQTYTLNADEAPTNLSSVTMVGTSSSVPEYFTHEKTDAGVIIKIFRPLKDSSGTHVSLIGQMTVPNVTDLMLPVMKADLGGSQPGYFVSALKPGPTPNDNPTVRYSYFTGNFQELFPGSNSIRMVDEGALFTPPYRFIKVALKDFGTIALPVFWSTAGVPKADADPDPFNFEPVNVSARRLYFYQPQRTGTGEMTFVTRLYDNYAFYKDLRVKLGAQVTDDLAIHELFGQSNADSAQSIFRLLGSFGNGVIRNYFQLKIQGSDLLNHTSQILKMSVPSSIDLQRQPMDETVAYSASSGRDTGTSAVGIFGLNQARVITFDDRTNSTSLESKMNISPDDSLEHFATGGSVHIRTFVMDRQPISFFEGDTHLIVQGISHGKAFHSEDTIYRSSFLPGLPFSQRFFPVLVSDGGAAKKPGLFVDNTMLFSATAQVWTLDENNQLSIPLALSYSLPDNCNSLNPARWSNQDVAVILCQDAQSKKIQKIMFMGL